MESTAVVRKAINRFAWLAAALWCAGAIAADLPSGLSAPPKPTQMPQFELPTTAGNTLRSESLRGQVVIVRYWASW